jgi:hypothetical protein
MVETIVHYLIEVLLSSFLILCQPIAKIGFYKDNTYTNIY